MNRGEIWLINFDPTIGDEIKKIRPAVVVNDDAVGIRDLAIVVPITNWSDHFSDSPWIVRLSPTLTNGLEKVPAADTFQVKSLSSLRFIKRLGLLSEHEMNKVTEALSFVLGIF
jgi:mRNA interferase MazF